MTQRRREYRWESGRDWNCIVAAGCVVLGLGVAIRRQARRPREGDPRVLQQLDRLASHREYLQAWGAQADPGASQGRLERPGPRGSAGAQVWLAPKVRLAPRVLVAPRSGWRRGAAGATGPAGARPRWAASRRFITSRRISRIQPTRTRPAQSTVRARRRAFTHSAGGVGWEPSRRAT